MRLRVALAEQQPFAANEITSEMTKLSILAEEEAERNAADQRDRADPLYITRRSAVSDPRR